MLAGALQWVFLADESCSAADDELLAVQLWPPHEHSAGAAEALLGAVVTFQDISVLCPDPTMVSTPTVQDSAASGKQRCSIQQSQHCT